MSTTSRRRVGARPRTVLGVGALGLALLVVAGPPGAASGRELAGTLDHALGSSAGSAVRSADATAPMVNDEVAIATLDPAGLPQRSQLVSRLTWHGDEREVLDPSSVTNVRYLDRLGRPETTAEGVLLTVGGDRPVALTEARFDKPLPVAVHVEYALAGQVVPADQVPGSDQEVTVTYTLTNTTAQDTELTWTDAAGVTHTDTKPVFAPFQGALTATLAAGSELLDSGDAQVATDAQGRTVLSWNVSLFPPISAPVQKVGLRMRAEGAAIPGAEVTLAPAAVGQDPGLGFSADLLKGTATGNEDLYRGLSDLDSGTTEVADATGQLAGGLAGVAGGAGSAADTDQQLASGVGDLATGAEAVASGSADLADALGRASTGAADLAEATEALASADSGDAQAALDQLIDAGDRIEAGLWQVVDRIGAPDDPTLPEDLAPDDDDRCPAGGTAPPDDDCITLYQAMRALREGLVGIYDLAGDMSTQAGRARAAAETLTGDVASIGSDSAKAAQGAGALLASLCTPPTATLDPASCAQLGAVAAASGSAAATAAGTAPTSKALLTSVITLDTQSAALVRATAGAVDAADEVLDSIAALGVALGAGTADDPGISAAMALLNDGLVALATALAEGQQQLDSALASVAAGSASLADGVEGAAAGAEKLAGGSGQLATGAAGAATGATSLSSGLSTLAGSTDEAALAGRQIAEGAQRLQREGTQPAAQGVLEASSDPAMARAWLAATDERAADALPYGAPEGAVGHVAYVFSLDAVDAPKSLWERIRAIFG